MAYNENVEYLYSVVFPSFSSSKEVDDEMKSKVGKVFEDGVKNLTLCLGYQRANGTLHFEGKVMSSDSLIESDWKLDGFPCGTFERQNEDGKWVE